VASSQAILGATTKRAVDTVEGAANQNSPSSRASGLASVTDGFLGASAGDGDSAINAWVSAGWNNLNDTNAATRSDGNIFTGMVGADYAISDDLLTGFALSAEGLKIDSSYNGGNTTSRGIGVMPYVVYRIDNVFSVTGIAGYTRVDGDTKRTAGAVGTNVSGSFSGNRFMFAAVGSANYLLGEFAINASAGLSWAE